MDNVMSAPDAEELMENGSPAAPHKQQSESSLVVMESVPSTNDTVPATPTIGKGEGDMSSAPKVVDSFPSASDTAPTTDTKEESEAGVAPVMVIKSFPSTPRIPAKGKNDKIEPSIMVIKTLPSVVKTSSTKMESTEDPIPTPQSKGDDIKPMIADLDSKGEHGHHDKPKGPFATGNFGDQKEAERKKKRKCEKQ